MQYQFIYNNIIYILEVRCKKIILKRNEDEFVSEIKLTCSEFELLSVLVSSSENFVSKRNVEREICERFNKILKINSLKNTVSNCRLKFKLLCDKILVPSKPLKEDIIHVDRKLGLSIGLKPFELLDKEKIVQKIKKTTLLLEWLKIEKCNFLMKTAKSLVLAVVLIVMYLCASYFSVNKSIKMHSENSSAAISDFIESTEKDLIFNENREGFNDFCRDFFRSNPKVQNIINKNFINGVKVFNGDNNIFCVVDYGVGENDPVIKIELDEYDFFVYFKKGVLDNRYQSYDFIGLASVNVFYLDLPVYNYDYDKSNNQLFVIRNKHGDFVFDFIFYYDYELFIYLLMMLLVVNTYSIMKFLIYLLVVKLDSVKLEPVVDVKNNGYLYFEVLSRYNFKRIPVFLFNRVICGTFQVLHLLMIKRLLLNNVEKLKGDKINIGVNIGPDILRKKYKSSLFKIVEELKVHYDLIIELTENVDYSKRNESLVIIAELQEKGIKIAIDDYGSGFSNLNSIYSLKPDFIKLDKTFILKSDLNEISVRVANFIGLASAVNAIPIIEGVESIQVSERLVKESADYQQGYLFKTINLSYKGK